MHNKYQTWVMKKEPNSSIVSFLRVHVTDTLGDYGHLHLILSKIGKLFQYVKR